MLAHLCNLHASPRKLRLFACACVGPDYYSLLELSRKAVIVAEKFADGEATEAELAEAANEAWAETYKSLADPVFAAACCVEREASQAAVQTAKYVSPSVQCKVLHDLFGPLPFRTPKIDPACLSWQDGAVVRLARKAHEATSRLVKKVHESKSLRLIGRIVEEIGDALNQAGCKDEEILAHCRSSTRHNKGCWVIDLILGLN
jgi:hypothetical protein